jgi:hypothetical protein
LRRDSICLWTPRREWTYISRQYNIAPTSFLVYCLTSIVSLSARSGCSRARGSRHFTAGVWWTSAYRFCFVRKLTGLSTQRSSGQGRTTLASPPWISSRSLLVHPHFTTRFTDSSASRQVLKQPHATSKHFAVRSVCVGALARSASRYAQASAAAVKDDETELKSALLDVGQDRCAYQPCARHAHHNNHNNLRSHYTLHLRHASLPGKRRSGRGAAQDQVAV